MRWLLLLLCFYLVGVLTKAGATLFLEQGHQGTIPCPLVKSRQIWPWEVDAMYWYYGPVNRKSLLISYFFGRVAPQNGIQEGFYNIDTDFNLVIENVTASNEGTYYYQVKPYLRMIREGQVEVRHKVPPIQPYPTVIGCNQDHHEADKCKVTVRHDCNVHNLICVMEQVKPAVELKWFLGGLTELKASTTVRHVVLPAYSGSSFRNNTYSTSASIQVPSVDGDLEYVCEAMGVAVGNVTRTKVRLAKTHPATVTYDEIQPYSNPGATLGLADEVTTNACASYWSCSFLLLLWLPAIVTMECRCV